MVAASRRVWIVRNAWLEWSTFDVQFHRLIEEAATVGIAASVTSSDWVAAHLDSLAQDELPDVALAYDKDVLVLSLLESRGVRVLNPVDAIRVCDDKAATYLALRALGIAQPRSVIVPLRFRPLDASEWGASHTLAAAEELGYPLVVKPTRSSWGKGILRVDSRDELLAALVAAEDRDVLIQAWHPGGSDDYRLFVVGRRVVAAMQRHAPVGQLAANVSAGGRAEAFTPTAEQARLAVAAARGLGLDVAGIDLLIDGDRAVVLEVNSNAQFVGLEEATGCNVAAEIVAQVVSIMGW
ncbi:ATP-grasp domain-containing protein [Corynebacterium uterequi]|uniref:Alpha-L-glutamate ligase, RimK family n=1 Tax=Corynebacterium uterequi TaxID=1072256 RepID=A0A0G3HEA2_9CORY|nr:RimK family alpha-L-glutamate ligase [Corynebacterium uterequi]AKK11646.1 alpha-L-glutamate ligase, RimK family [Corynebacterium uterequi]